MKLFKKNKGNKSEIHPIFPIYLNTMRIKDTIAILEDGISSMRSVTNEIAADNSTSFEAKGDGSIYKINLGLDGQLKKNKTSKQNEHYEKIHTDASLFYKVLMEFKHNDRIKTIKCKEDLKDITEGNIVLCEGKISGNEIESLFNKLYVYAEAMSISQDKKAKEIKKQLEGVERVLTRDDKITDTSYMICQLDDGTELALIVEDKYLIGDSGVELVRGKYKILGIVYEKITNKESINLTRDGLLGLFKSEDVEKLYAELTKGLSSAKLDIPSFKTSISGPSVGIMPIGIYL